MPTKKQREKLLQERQMRETQTGKPKSLSKKQLRARARRAAAKHQRVSDELFDQLYKPLEEWDVEELARGRPRGPEGTFCGAKPKWIDRELHERAVDRFKDIVKSEMRVGATTAMQVILMLLESEETDDKGRPVVPASVKLEAAKFLIEHQIGKPVQPVQGDVSIRLQGLLGNVLVMPSEIAAAEALPDNVRRLPSFVPSSSHRVLEGSLAEEPDEESPDHEET